MSSSIFSLPYLVDKAALFMTSFMTSFKVIDNHYMTTRSEVVSEVINSEMLVDVSYAT